MNKRPDITDATRQRFIDAFCLLYRKHPVEKITVKEIAAIAGHNRVTFYQYFHDPYEILETLEKELFEHISSVIEENIGKADMFEGFEEVFAQILNEKADLADMLLTGKNYSSTLERCKNAMLPFLERAFQLDENDLKTKAVLEFYLSGVLSLLKFKVDHNEDVSNADLGSVIKNYLQKSVLPQLQEPDMHAGKFDAGRESKGTL